MADRSVLVRVKADISDFNKGILAASAGAKAFASELDTSTDRATNLTQSVLALGPALVPIGAAAVPAIAGLTNGLAFAAAGAGVTALAFSGVGDALKAVNDYQIEPTTANLEKMSQAMDELGPAGQSFVSFLQDIRPELQGLQDIAQAGLLPGAEDGIRELMDLMPQVERIVAVVSTAIGDLIAEAVDNLNDARWRDFFTFIETEARPTLIEMGRTLGNFAEGFANLWMAFSPVSSDFSASFLQLSRDFAKWTDGLSQTQGFQEFVAYIERVGPKAWETLGALGNALLQIVEAAAPVGEVMLPVIEALADTFAAIADSDIGPILIGAAAGISAVSRAVALYNAANGSAFGKLMSGSAYAGAGKGLRDLPTALLQYDGAAARAQKSASTLAGTTTRLGGALRSSAKLAGGGAGLAFVMSDLDDKAGLSNTAMLTLAGSMVGPWGAAVGAGAGLAMDFAAANDDVTDAIQRADAALGNNSTSYKDQIAAIDVAIAKIDEYNKTIGGDADGSNYLGDVKNQFESFFGKSDEDENSDERKRLVGERKDAERAAQDQRLAEAGLGDALKNSSQATRDSVEATLRLVEARNEAANQALTDREAERSLQEAIDNANDAAKENGKTLDDNTPKGRANARALDAIASSWNNLSDEAKRAPGAQRAARKAFIDAAIAMGKSKAEARKLADALFAIPTKTKVQIAADTADALNKLRGVKDYIAGINGKTIKINVERGTPGGITKNADGGYIRGPGTTTSDSIPALLSDREYVIKAAAVEKYGVGMFHQLNAMQYASGGMVQRFADGGSTANSVTVSGTAIDNRALARAVSSATARELRHVFGQGVRVVGSGKDQRLELMGG